MITTNSPRRIMLLGDTHGDLEHIQYAMQEANLQSCDAIFVLGDFGFWEHADGGKFLDKCSKFAQHFNIDIYWLDGNHEAHDLLRRRYIDNGLVETTQDGFVVIRDRLYHAPRALAWNWAGVRFMALGGAYSVDKEYRLVHEGKQKDNLAKFDALEQSTNWPAEYEAAIRAGDGISWWPEEEITEAEVDLALAHRGEIDVLLCHDKPLHSSPGWNRKDLEECLPNQEKIQRVINKLHPKFVYHGHLHFRYIDVLDTGVIVEGLDCNKEAAMSPYYTRDQSWKVLDLDKV